MACPPPMRNYDDRVDQRTSSAISPSINHSVFFFFLKKHVISLQIAYYIVEHVYGKRGTR